jgi:DNA polymerase-3 subunit beta
MPASDYPHLENLPFEESFVVPQANLKAMIDSVEHAIAHQDVRYYLNGLMMEVKPGSLILVATDGHRLAISEVISEVHAVAFLLPRLLLEASDDPFCIHQHVSTSASRLEFQRARRYAA